MKKLIVNIDDQGKRLDKFLAKNGYGFSVARKLIRRNKVMVNNEKEDASYKLSKNDVIGVSDNSQTYKFIKSKSPLNTEKLEQLKKSIIYKDENIIVFNKPSGFAVQSGNKKEFTIDCALPYLKFDNEETPRLVHRLDRDTSGILLIARNRAAAAILTEGFKTKKIKKTYLALVNGKPKIEIGTIKIPLLEKSLSNSKKVFANQEQGKEAITNYQLVRNFGDLSLMRLNPVTGRMHQLRVHLKEIGHPILGDKKYGKKEKLHPNDTEYNKNKQFIPNRLCLHSYQIEIKNFFGKNFSLTTQNPDFLKRFT